MRSLKNLPALHMTTTAQNLTFSYRKKYKKRKMKRTKKILLRKLPYKKKRC